jgi:glycosyltransferase involved in cell wall biosynthesis
MGVTTDFFCDGYDHDIELPIKMCFIGKETSSGVDNNLDQFISMLARSVARNSPVELYLVGLEGSSALRFQNYSNQFLEIKTIDHIDHTKLGEYLAQMDCGVIPYESNRYHAFRFPIKSLEYAAAGLIILVNRTQSISKIIPEDAAVFFSYDSKDSLRLALLKLLEKEEMEGVRLRASGWAMNFSYEKRARKLVSFLEINQSEKS